MPRLQSFPLFQMAFIKVLSLFFLIDFKAEGSPSPEDHRPPGNPVPSSFFSPLFHRHRQFVFFVFPKSLWTPYCVASEPTAGDHPSLLLLSDSTTPFFLWRQTCDPFDPDPHSESGAFQLSFEPYHVIFGSVSVLLRASFSIYLILPFAAVSPSVVPWLR